MKGIFITALILFISGTVHAKQCNIGKPCGRTCIARNKICHKNADLNHVSSNRATAINNAPSQNIGSSIGIIKVTGTVVNKPHVKAQKIRQITNEAVYAYEEKDGFYRISKQTEPIEWVNLQSVIKE